MKTTSIITLATTVALLAGCRGGESGAGIASATDGEDTSGETDDPTTDPTGSGATTDDPTETSGVDESGTTDDPDPTAGGDYEPVYFDCPFPGSLPFEFEGTDWQDPANEQFVADNPRSKDEFSDIIGNPGGAVAHTTIDLEASPGPNQDLFEGAKLRTTINEGAGGMPVVGEYVSLWRYDGADWTQVARGLTDDFGAYSFDDVDLSENNLQPLYSVMDADGSCSEHYTFLLDPGTQIVITDIDGTMTLSDAELFTQIMDGNYDPLENTGAAEMMRLWASKGYTIVYLTARPHNFRSETRTWLREHDFPLGPVISSNSLVFGDAAATYKRTWGRRIVDDFGWDIIAAYGNATSDIQAYEDAEIPKDITFIIGENAGVGDTMPILENDYTAHIADFVQPYPDAG